MVSKNFDILTIGDCVLDHFVKLDPKVVASAASAHGKCLMLGYGQKIPATAFEFFPGGNALNTAAGFSRLGLRTAIYTHLGMGPDGEYLRNRIRTTGVSEQFIESSPAIATDKSIILVVRGERTVLSYHCNKLYNLPRNFSSKWLYLTSLSDGYERLYRQVVSFCKQSDIKLAFNPGTRQLLHSISNVRRVISQASILFVNVEEAQRILAVRLKNPKVLLGGLYKFGANIVAITDGPRGAYAYDGSTAYFIRAFPARRVDATGAGDSFACAVTTAIMLGHGLAEALRWGSVNSASEIASIGVQNGLLTREKILERLKRAPSYQPKKLGI